MRASKVAQLYACNIKFSLQKPLVVDDYTTAKLQCLSMNLDQERIDFPLTVESNLAEECLTNINGDCNICFILADDYNLYTKASLISNFTPVDNAITFICKKGYYSTINFYFKDCDKNPLKFFDLTMKLYLS